LAQLLLPVLLLLVIGLHLLVYHKLIIWWWLAVAGLEVTVQVAAVLVVLEQAQV
jgi:hypothetical protein